MKKFLVSLAVAVAASLPQGNAAPLFVGDLQTASTFAVLAGTGVTSAGTSALTGDLGVLATNAISGFASGGGTVGSGTVHGTIYNSGSVVTQAIADARVAYNALNGQTGTFTPGAMPTIVTYAPGVRKFSGDANTMGATITLDGGGSPLRALIS